LFRHKRQQTVKALAELLLVIFVRSFGEFLLKTFQSPAPSALLPIDIDNRSAQDSIEPSGRLLVRIRVPICRQSFDQAVLDNVFGQMVIAEAASSKPDKHVEILENCIFNASHADEVNFGAHARKQNFELAQLAKLPGQ